MAETETRTAKLGPEFSKRFKKILSFTTESYPRLIIEPIGNNKVLITHKMGRETYITVEAPISGSMDPMLVFAHQFSGKELTGDDTLVTRWTTRLFAGKHPVRSRTMTLNGNRYDGLSNLGGERAEEVLPGYRAPEIPLTTTFPLGKAFKHLRRSQNLISIDGATAFGSGYVGGTFLTYNLPKPFPFTMYGISPTDVGIVASVMPDQIQIGRKGDHVRFAGNGWSVYIANTTDMKWALDKSTEDYVERESDVGSGFMHVESSDLRKAVNSLKNRDAWRTDDLLVNVFPDHLQIQSVEGKVSATCPITIAAHPIPAHFSVD